eukprot:COSAG01_NODE_23434_length_815_cov_1.252793_1_plen_32_part_10
MVLCTAIHSPDVLMAGGAGLTTAMFPLESMAV